jgi:uncharacterized membrane protein
MLFYFILLIFGATFGVALYQSFYLIRAVDLIYYSLRMNETLPAVSIGVYFALPTAAIFILCGYFLKRKFGQQDNFTTLFIKAASPLCLLLPALLLPIRFYTPLVFCFISGITTFRLAILLLPRIAIKRPVVIPWRTGVLISIFLMLIATYCGFYFQLKSHKSFFLHYMDWAFYLTCFKNCADGKGLLSTWGYSMFGAHWMPTAAFFMVPFVWMFRSFTAVFLLNSLLIYSGAALLWMLSRRFRISSGTALILSLCYVINPSLSQLSLTLYYGFNPLYFFIPLFFIFFYFFSGKQKITSAIMYLAVIMIKETVAIFWIGFGGVMLFKKKIKLGLTLIFTSIAYWVVVTGYIMPLFHPDGRYEQTFHYGYLGNSYKEIVLATVLKPYIILSKLLEYQNIYFICLLVLPLFMLVLSNPLLLFADAIVLVFVCLQGGNEIQNIMFQHQTEMLALLFINCIVCINQIRNRGYNQWFRFFAAGLPTVKRKTLINCCLASIIVTSSLGYFFFGKTLVLGKASFAPIQQLPDFTPLVEKIKTIIPENATAIMTPHLASHFCLRNDVFMIASPVIKEYIVLDLSDNSDSLEVLEKLRKQVIRSNDYNPIFSHNFLGRQIVIYKKMPKTKPADFIKSLSPDEWLRCGDRMYLPTPDFECRVKPDSSWRFIDFFIKPRSKVNYDTDIDIVLTNGEKTWYLNTAFGHGIYPAYLMTGNQVFILRVPVPAGWQKLDSVNMKIAKREFSDLEP